MVVDGRDDLFLFPPRGNVVITERRVRRAILGAYGGLDFWRQCPLELDDMCLDHVIPRSLEGPDNLFNLVPTNASMNRRKAHSYDEIAIIPVLSIIRLHYAPKIMASLRIGQLDPWWRVDPDKIAQPPIETSWHLTYPPMTQVMENYRYEIADILLGAQRDDWGQFVNHLGPTLNGQLLTKHVVRNAWMAVVRRERIPLCQ